MVVGALVFVRETKTQIVVEYCDECIWMAEAVGAGRERKRVERELELAGEGSLAIVH